MCHPENEWLLMVVTMVLMGRRMEDGVHGNDCDDGRVDGGGYDVWRYV